jgi:hypothetical protein
VRLVLALGVAALTAFVAPTAAGAHLRSGRIAVDYRADVSQLPAGVDARVYRSDLALGLTVAPGHEVVVLGYVGEPVIRFDAAGIAANEASPTAVGTGLLKGTPRRQGGAPRWRRLSSSHSIVWHDARLRGLPPGVTHRRWTVPLVVDGSRATLGGELRRVAAPSSWPWLTLGVVVAVAVGILLAVRRQLIRTATVLFGCAAAAATAATALGFALGSTASEGAWVEAANELVFVLVGLVFVARGSRDTQALAGGALGLLGLAVGLTKLPALLHGIVLSALPAAVARASVALAICAGAAAAVLGVVVFFDVLERYEEPYEGATSRSGRSNAR